MNCIYECGNYDVGEVGETKRLLDEDQRTSFKPNPTDWAWTRWHYTILSKNA